MVDLGKSWSSLANQKNRHVGLPLAVPLRARAMAVAALKAYTTGREQSHCCPVRMVPAPCSSAQRAVAETR